MTYHHDIEGGVHAYGQPGVSGGVGHFGPNETEERGPDWDENQADQLAILAAGTSVSAFRPANVGHALPADPVGVVRRDEVSQGLVGGGGDDHSGVADTEVEAGVAAYYSGSEDGNGEDGGVKTPEQYIADIKECAALIQNAVDEQDRDALQELALWRRNAAAYVVQAGRLEEIRALDPEIGQQISELAAYSNDQITVWADSAIPPQTSSGKKGAGGGVRGVDDDDLEPEILDALDGTPPPAQGMSKTAKAIFGIGAALLIGLGALNIYGQFFATAPQANADASKAYGIGDASSRDDERSPLFVRNKPPPVSATDALTSAALLNIGKAAGSRDGTSGVIGQGPANVVPPAAPVGGRLNDAVVEGNGGGGKSQAVAPLPQPKEPEAKTTVVAAVPAGPSPEAVALEAANKRIANLEGMVAKLTSDLTASVKAQGDAVDEIKRAAALREAAPPPPVVPSSSEQRRNRNSEASNDRRRHREESHRRQARDQEPSGASSRCELKGATDGSFGEGKGVAWIGNKNSEDVAEIAVGQSHSCVGTVKRVYDNGSEWVVVGSSHVLKMSSR